jgi:hypothetical protein
MRRISMQDVSFPRLGWAAGMEQFLRDVLMVPGTQGSEPRISSLDEGEGYIPFEDEEELDEGDEDEEEDNKDEEDQDQDDDDL